MIGRACEMHERCSTYRVLKVYPAIRDISDGWIGRWFLCCPEKLRFSTTADLGFEPTIRNRSHGHRPSEVGMWSNFRGSRMPVRSRVRPVLFMSVSVTARLRVIAKHGCSSSRARRSSYRAAFDVFFHWETSELYVTRSFFATAT